MACSIAQNPMHTFLLVQEIPDEPTFNRLVENLKHLKAFPLGTSEKVLIIISPESHEDLARRVFDGLDQKVKALLVPLADTALGRVTAVA